MDESKHGDIQETEATTDFVSPEIVEETLKEAENFFHDGVSAGKPPRKKPTSTSRTAWTIEEEKEIQVRFRSFFDKKIRPKPQDCMRAILRSKRDNGLLGERRKDVLKKKVFRMIDKVQ